MPRLNRTGEFWCSGIAGAGFYVGDFDTRGNARVLHHQDNAGMRGWFTDDLAITQFGDSQVLGINARTGARVAVDGQGASEVQANGGVWAAFTLDGVRTSTGLKFPSAYIGASTGPARNDCIGPDGQIAIKEKYHSFGPWHVYRSDGSRWLLASGDAANIQLLGGDRAIYRQGWQWFATGDIPVPKPVTAIAWGLKLLETPEGWWLVYQAEDGRVVAHPNGNALGYILGSVTDAFGLDALRLADGRFSVIWATTEGENPRDIVTTYFSLSNPRVSVSPEITVAPTRPPVTKPPNTVPAPNEEPKSIMSIPNLVHIVRQVDAAHPHLLRENSPESCTEFLWRAAEALTKVDSGFGLLTKSAGEKHTVIDGHLVSIDAVAYRKDGVISNQVVDIISAAHDGPRSGGVAWGVAERRDSNKWLAVPRFQEHEVVNPPVIEDPPAPPSDEVDFDGLISSIVNQVVSGVRESLDTQIQALRKELDELTFEGRNRLLGTITFTRKK